MDYRVYSVSRKAKAPLLRFMLDALEAEGCRILHEPSAGQAPFRITFETPGGERMGVIAYAFFANSKVTRNRPQDEHRFQLKYGSKEGGLHTLWQDPYQLYTTVLVGIDPERGIFVGADPKLHSPTKLFISIEFKHHQVEEIQRLGWHAWERDRRVGEDTPVEVLVGGTASSFLRYLRFERDARGLDPGHRQLLAEKMAGELSPQRLVAATPSMIQAPQPERLHALSREFEMDEAQVLDLISSARRLKMAVRGWVAEEHLVRQLRLVPGVTDCERNDAEGQPDVSLRFEGRGPLRIECKNVLRQRTADNTPRLDFQRTRASKGDPCSRYYCLRDFDVVAACLHAVTERWEFRYALTEGLEPHTRCEGRLASNVRVDARWAAPVEDILRAAAT